MKREKFRYLFENEFSLFFIPLFFKTKQNCHILYTVFCLRSKNHCKALIKAKSLTSKISSLKETQVASFDPWRKRRQATERRIIWALFNKWFFNFRSLKIDLEQILFRHLAKRCHGEVAVEKTDWNDWFAWNWTKKHFLLDLGRQTD